MDSNKIMSASLIDILFEGKNKEYGAYQLRKTYNKRMTIAMISMALACLLFFLTRIIANGHDKHMPPMMATEYILKDLKRKEPTPEPISIKPPKVDPPRVQITRFTPPVIVIDKDVVEPPPAVETLDKSQIGLIDQTGETNVDFVAPPVEQTMGVAEVPKAPKEEYEGTFTRVEKEAKFPGGMEAWKRYLERNLNAEVAGNDGAPTGNYSVTVQFIVDKDGNISNVHAIDVPKVCPSCGPEAVKVIRNGGKWEPAIQNGKKVTYQAVQMVTFQVAEE